MVGPEFFARLGLFIVKDFFDAELCARLRLEARSSSGVAAKVRKGNSETVDEMVRKTNRTQMSAATTRIVQTRLLDLKPQLERHFEITLYGCETPQFLRYEPGYFFGPHKDVAADPDAPESMRARRVSVVTFLNGDAALPGVHGYTGGSLTLYGLIDDENWKTRGFPLAGLPGLLIAFRADTIHEVTPVTSGERYSIATWFF